MDSDKMENLTGGFGFPFSMLTFDSSAHIMTAYDSLKRGDGMAALKCKYCGGNVSAFSSATTAETSSRTENSFPPDFGGIFPFLAHAQATVSMRSSIGFFSVIRPAATSRPRFAASRGNPCSCTPDVSAFTKTADIVVVAAGRPNTLRGDMLKPGAVVIDVGVNRIPDASKPKGFRLVGDADFESCAAVASAITPVPGGVGPMTITMLLWNTLESARRDSGCRS